MTGNGIFPLHLVVVCLCVGFIGLCKAIVATVCLWIDLDHKYMEPLSLCREPTCSCFRVTSYTVQWSLSTVVTAGRPPAYSSRSQALQWRLL